MLAAARLRNGQSRPPLRYGLRECQCHLEGHPGTCRQLTIQVNHTAYYQPSAIRTQVECGVSLASNFPPKPRCRAFARLEVCQEMKMSLCTVCCRITLTAEEVCKDKGLLRRGKFPTHRVRCEPLTNICLASLRRVRRQIPPTLEGPNYFRLFQNISLTAKHASDFFRLRSRQRLLTARLFRRLRLEAA